MYFRLADQELSRRDKHQELIMALPPFSLLFLLLLLPCIASQTTTVPVPTISAEIAPGNSSVQREGDTVSLLCRVDDFDPERFLLSWYAAHISSFSSADAPYTQQDSYSATFESVDSSSSSYIFNLTIHQLVLSDSGTYFCNLFEKVNVSATTGIAQLSLVLRVYPPDAFPTCKPLDRSSIVVGSQLECQTNGAVTPEINGSNDTLTFSMQNDGQVLNKNATLEDNDRTFICSAITANTSRMPLSCNIGPLTVVESLSLSTFSAGSEDVTVSPVGTTISNAGVSAAALSGIVVGAIVLIILIAIHTFCCHCNPKKWMNAKSYLVNLCSSDGTLKKGSDSTKEQTEVEMGNSDPEKSHVPPPYNSVSNEASGETNPSFLGDIRQVSMHDPIIYEEPSVAEPNLNLNIDLHLNVNISPADGASTPGPADETPPAGTDPWGNLAPEVSYATVDPTPPDDDRQTDSAPRQVASAGLVRNPSDSPQIYAKVNKHRSAAEDTNDVEHVNVPSGKIGKPVPPTKPKGIKKFGADKEKHKSLDDAAPKGVVYADINLDVDGEGGKVPPSMGTTTVYAQIRH